MDEARMTCWEPQQVIDHDVSQLQLGGFRVLGFRAPSW